MGGILECPRWLILSHEPQAVNPFSLYSPSIWLPRASLQHGSLMIVRVHTGYLASSLRVRISRSGKQILFGLLRIRLRTSKISLLTYFIGYSNHRQAQTQRTPLDWRMTHKYKEGEIKSGHFGDKLS